MVFAVLLEFSFESGCVAVMYAYEWCAGTECCGANRMNCGASVRARDIVRYTWAATPC